MRLRWLLLLTIALAISFPATFRAEACGAEPTPEMVPGKLLEKFLQAFNSGDAELLENFVREHYQPGVDAAVETRRWLRHHSVYGPLELHSVVRSSNSLLRVFTRGRITKAWVELTVRMSRESAHRLRTIAVGEGLRPDKPCVDPKPRTTPEINERIGSYMDRLDQNGFFSGVLLVAKEREPIFAQAYGLADRAHAAPNRVDTRFNVGSITKVFTALALFQLVEKGRLRLEDAAAPHLTRYPGGLDARIRLEHLLTHTSGVGRGAFDRPIFPPHIRSVSDWLPLTVAEPEFEPGEDVRYSNGAWIILGAIIEQVTDTDYFEHVRSSVYRQAGMVDSGAFERDRPLPNVAVSYTHAKATGDDELVFDPGPRRSAILLNGVRGNPAGLTYSTAGDLLRFRNALMANRLLGPYWTERFLEAQVELPSEPDAGVRNAYGFGWELDTVGKTTIIGKAGGSWGVSARFDMYPASGFTVIVLSNFDSAATVVANHIRDLLVEELDQDERRLP